MAWNLFYTEEELKKAREKADEFAGIKYEQPTAGAMETLFPSNVTYSYQDGQRVENVVPIADKQVVNQVQSNGNAPVRNTNKMGLYGGTPTIPYTEENVPQSFLNNIFGDSFRMPIGIRPENAERAAERLMYYDTPLKYRTQMKSPRELDLEQAKTAASAGKARSTNFYKNVTASEIPSSVLVNMFTPESGGFFGMSKTEAESLGNSRAAAYISKRGEMIAQGLNPTHQQVLDALKPKEEEK